MVLTQSYIYIENIRLHAYHGVLPQEHLTGNDYAINVRLRVDVSHAIATDEVDDTVSYADVYDLVVQEMAIPSHLLEHVAGRIGERIFNRWHSVAVVEIKLTKINPPMGGDCDGAGIELHLINDKTKR